MASKIVAKTRMRAAGVPVLPGYAGAEQDLEHLTGEAQRAGLPLMVKPAAGGGGKGMQIVREPAELAPALAAARRLAASAFGDGTLLLERYLPAPRHIEVQVFADGHGNLVHLGERDCSIQRRHQKLIEEAPAPALPEELRARLRAAALVVAREVGYVSAGTVEFLLDGGEFYFMEMNTRLQVEHTVTEAVTGLDLVEWQLRGAAGGTLPLSQSGGGFGGHAIEARIRAEGPGRGLLPGGPCPARWRGRRRGARPRGGQPLGPGRWLYPQPSGTGRLRLLMARTHPRGGAGVRARQARRRDRGCGCAPGTRRCGVQRRSRRGTHRDAAPAGALPPGRRARVSVDRR